MPVAAAAIENAGAAYMAVAEDPGGGERGPLYGNLQSVSSRAYQRSSSDASSKVPSSSASSEYIVALDEARGLGGGLRRRRGRRLRREARDATSCA